MHHLLLLLLLQSATALLLIPSAVIQLVTKSANIQRESENKKDHNRSIHMNWTIWLFQVLYSCFCFWCFWTVANYWVYLPKLIFFFVWEFQLLTRVRWCLFWLHENKRKSQWSAFEREQENKIEFCVIFHWKNEHRLSLKFRHENVLKIDFFLYSPLPFIRKLSILFISNKFYTINAIHDSYNL